MAIPNDSCINDPFDPKKKNKRLKTDWITIRIQRIDIAARIFEGKENKHESNFALLSTSLPSPIEVLKESHRLLRDPQFLMTTLMRRILSMVPRMTFSG